MKKQLVNISILAITLVIMVFSSCKKENEIKTATEYLTQSNWKISAVTINPGIDIDGELVTDIYAVFDACQTDDLMRFNADGTITQDEGATKCDPNDPQTTDGGKWELSNNNNTFTITTVDEDPIVGTINTLNDSNFAFSYGIEGPDENGNLITYTYNLTMVSH